MKGKSNDPLSRKHYVFSFVLPSNSFVSVSNPWRAFWVDTAPFQGPRLASCIASRTAERQGHSQVFCGWSLGHRTPLKTADPNPAAWFEDTPFTQSLDCKVDNKIELSNRPAELQLVPAGKPEEVSNNKNSVSQDNYHPSTNVAPTSKYDCCHEAVSMWAFVPGFYKHTSETRFFIAVPEFVSRYLFLNFAKFK